MRNSIGKHLKIILFFSIITLSLQSINSQNNEVMKKEQLRHVVESTLAELGLNHSEHATNLVLGTIAQESRNGYYIRQLGSGYARGIAQCEEPTFDYLKKKYLNPDTEDGRYMTQKIMRIANVISIDFETLETNMVLAIIFCRLKYWSTPCPIPTDMDGYAFVWKKYYNSYKGKGTEEQFIESYKEYVL